MGITLVKTVGRVGSLPFCPQLSAKTAVAIISTVTCSRLWRCCCRERLQEPSRSVGAGCIGVGSGVAARLDGVGMSGDARTGVGTGVAGLGVGAGVDLARRRAEPDFALSTLLLMNRL